MNKTITEKIKDKDILDKLQTPCSCFVTFESEEGYQRAKMYNDCVSDSIQNFSLIKKSTKDEKKKEQLVKERDSLVPLYYAKFLGESIDVQEASEPTDIIWENRQITPAFRFKQTIIVWIIIGIMLSISGAIIYVCSYTSTSLKLRYPSTDCDDTNAMYAENA